MSLRSRRPVLDSARFGRTPVPFLLVLAVCCLVAIVALVIVVAQRGPAPALVEEFTRRGLFGPLFQALFTSMIGLGIAYAASRRTGGHPAIAAGWIAAVALDALWNHSVPAGGTSLLATYVILIAALIGVIVVVVIDRQRVVAMITMFIPDFEHPEVVMVTDVRMLASLRLRRLGRQWARLNLGIDGKRAMARYQLAATELAMACNRNSFGRTTTEAYVRHRDDSLDLMRAAAAIVRRQEQLYPPPWLAPGDPSAFVAPAVGPTPPKTTWPRPPRA